MKKEKTVLGLYDGESGKAIVVVPEEAIDACSHQGSCDDDVAYWLDRVDWIADDDTLRAMLKGYGTWDDLKEASQETLRSRALWILCGDERERREEAKGKILLDATPSNAPCCFRIECKETGKDILIQTDYDWPGVSGTFGGPSGCDCGASDGTIDCRECNLTASYMIQRAGEWIREHDGAEAEDPGYF